MRKKIEVAILMWIFKCWFRQSESHARNIRLVYGLIRQALIREFYEDSPASLKAFSDERYESIWEPVWKSEKQNPTWPWCEACNSWHSPNNPTCKLKLQGANDAEVHTQRVSEDRRGQ